MLITNRKNSKFTKFNEFSTNLLMGECNTGSKDISIQITDVRPNGMQFLHSHAQAQCYYIVSGKGLMIIDDENKEVVEGDAIFVPPHSLHGIKNTGSCTLIYLTANQSFGVEKELELWPENPQVE